MPGHAFLRPALLSGWRRLERVFDAAFGSARNPLRHLGALGFLCFWLLALSGIYLYAVIDTSVEGAYPSIERLARQPWYTGGWLRSLHRYAADAFVLLMAAHLLREWLHGRYQGFRRFSWLTGVPLIVFAFISAIGGFWLNWDRLGHFSALASAEWFDALPWLATPLARNFLSAEAVGDRLFSLFVFVHLGVPLLMVFGLWFHIQRLARAAVFPPRALALGLGGVLLALTATLPVTSQGPADLAAVPTALALDWILLFVHPLVAATSAGGVWLAVAAGLGLLFALPFLPQPARAPTAQVDAPHCNGCRRCFEDCPYAAITMQPHPTKRVGMELARVDADLCAGCGLCVGSCPTASPFRAPPGGLRPLVAGIEMPQLTMQALRERLRQALAASTAPHPIVLFGCAQGARVDRLTGADVIALNLVCAGMLPPTFVDYALHQGAAAVLVSGCREGGCEYRLGQRWTAARLSGSREPHLRASVPRERVATVWADAGDEAALRRTLERMRSAAHAAALVEQPAHG